MFLSPRTVVALLIAGVAGGIITIATESAGSVVWLGGSVLIALSVIGDVVLAANPSALSLERLQPDVARVGEAKPVGIRVGNPTSRNLKVSVRDATLPSMRREPLRHNFVVPGGGYATAESNVRPSRRGWMNFGPVSVRVFGPLGFAGRQKTLALTGSMKVIPNLPGRKDVELRINRARMLQVGERSTRIRGGGSDFDSLREYHPDDEFRRINWKATARSSHAITNIYREEKNQHVIVLLDSGRFMAQNINGVSRFEHGIDAALVVAELAARVGDHVGLVAFAGKTLVHVGPRTGQAQPARLLDNLFDLEPTLEASDYRGAFSSLLTRHRRRALLILITELTHESVLEPLLEAVPALLARHLLIVGSIQDPELEELGVLMPAESKDVYLKASAIEASASRDRAASHLRKLGVQVIDRPAGQLAGRLADAYLNIKAYGRL